MTVEKLKKFDEYLDGLKTRGECLPRHISQMRPNFRAISAASGVGYKYLCTRPFKQRIRLAVKEIGLDSREESRGVRTQRLYEKNCALLSTYLRWLEENGHRLPAHPKHRGRIFFGQVEVEAGLNNNSLRQNYAMSDDAPGARLTKLVKSAAARLGVEVRILPQFPGRRVEQLSYERLRERGGEARAVELENRPRARQQLYNTRTALNRFLKLLRLKTTDAVGEELAAAFENSLAKVTGKINAPASRRKLQTELRWWRDFYRGLIRERSAERRGGK